MTEASIKSGQIAARRTVAQNALRLLKSAPGTAWFGMIVILIYGFVAVFAPLIAPYGESQVLGDAYLPSSAQHWLGTDQLGRDMLTRLIYGARNTIGIALLTVLLAFALGGSMGILSAIFRGWLDQILGRIVDVFMSIPELIFALMLLSIVGPSATSIILIIAVLDSTRFCRSLAGGRDECRGDGFR